MLAPGGYVAVPDAPGLGHEPIEDLITEHTRRELTLTVDEVRHIRDDQ